MRKGEVLLVAGAAAGFGVIGFGLLLLDATPGPSRGDSPSRSEPLAIPQAPRSPPHLRRVTTTDRPAHRRVDVVVAGAPRHLLERFRLSAGVSGSPTTSWPAVVSGRCVLLVDRAFAGWLEIEATHRATGWRTRLSRRRIVQGRDRVEIDLSLVSAAQNTHALRVRVALPVDEVRPVTLIAAPIEMPAAVVETGFSPPASVRSSGVWVHGLRAGRYLVSLATAGHGEASYRAELGMVNVRGDTEAAFSVPSGGTVTVEIDGDAPGARLEVRRSTGEFVPYAQWRDAEGNLVATGLASGDYLLQVVSDARVSNRTALELDAAWPRRLRLTLGARSALSVRAAGHASELSVHDARTESEISLTLAERALGRAARPVHLVVRPGTYRIAARIGAHEVSRTVEVRAPSESVVIPER